MLLFVVDSVFVLSFVYNRLFNTLTISFPIETLSKQASVYSRWCCINFQINEGMSELGRSKVDKYSSNVRTYFVNSIELKNKNIDQYTE